MENPSFSQGVIDLLANTKQRYVRYNHSDKGKARARQWEEAVRTPKRRIESVERYLTKEFVAWDGEGFTETDGSHTYVLLANSDGKSIYRRGGIPTIEVLEMFLAARKGVTNIIYGGSYDFNMILKDLSKDHLERLYETGVVRWGRYLLQWRAGKSLMVIAKDRRSFVIYDVVSFFQKTFVKACDEYLGTDWPYRDEIIREKANRSNFDDSKLETIIEYCNAELVVLIQLANELRTRLYNAGIRVRTWDGPGAIAISLFKHYHIKDYMGEVPEPVAEAARYAYAGGRFENVLRGHSDNPVFQYDIRSAYPAAIRFLPCLAHGQWRHVSGRPDRLVHFGVYRIRTNRQGESTGNFWEDWKPRMLPQPLWNRLPNKEVHYAFNPHSWYWTPEAQIVWDDSECEFIEGWEYEQTCECQPFGFVEELYEKRAQLKREGNGAHVGLKLGLNSMYGKLAQQIGWKIRPDGTLRIPPYHCLEWAGWVTSHCRAQVWNAIKENRSDVIAFETDAVFSRVPLPVDIGESLGQWEATYYRNMTYIQSGFYYGLALDDKTGEYKEVERCRGINRGSLSRESVIEALHNGTAFLSAPQTRFVTLGLALHQKWEEWRRWITIEKDITLRGGVGKRIDGLTLSPLAQQDDGWIQTMVNGLDKSVVEMSTPFNIGWLNPTERSREIAQMEEEMRHEMGWD